MDVLDSISCVFLFMAAGPFLEKLFLTSAPQNYLQRPRKKESAQDRSALAGCGKTRCEALIAKDDSIKELPRSSDEDCVGIRTQAADGLSSAETMADSPVATGVSNGQPRRN